MKRVSSALVVALLGLATCGCITLTILDEATAPLRHSKGPLLGRTVVALEEVTLQETVRVGEKYVREELVIPRGSLVTIVDVELGVMGLGGRPIRSWMGEFIGSDGKPTRKSIGSADVEDGAIAGYALITQTLQRSSRKRRWEIVPRQVTTAEQLRAWEQGERSATVAELMARVNDSDWAVGARALEALRQRPFAGDGVLGQLRQIESKHGNPEIRLRATLVILQWTQPSG